MTKVRVHISTSLDGYVAGPNESMEEPLGHGGEALHDWLIELKAWREASGMEGGIENANTPVFKEALANVGAEIMGRGKFGPPSRGPWGDDPWRGWWGDDPPFHKPVFVLTHHPREDLVMQGGTTFVFVTGGVQEAYERASETTGDGRIAVAGGASTINQFLKAGLIDELRLHIAPVLLGAGERLFDGVPPLRLEQVSGRSASLVTHITYRVSR